MVVVQSLSRVWPFVTPCTVACQASLFFTIPQSLLRLMSTELVMLSNHLILCRPLLLLPSIFPSIRVFSNESALHFRWPKYWSFSSASVLPMTIQDWFPLGLNSLISLGSKGLQHHSSKASVLRCSAFFTVQLLHPYMTTGKTIDFTRQTYMHYTVLIDKYRLGALILSESNGIKWGISSGRVKESVLKG